MTIHYMDGGPFETILSTRVKPVRVIAYDSRFDRFIASYTGDGQAFEAPSHYFYPPPPKPAAARKPRVGEVWRYKDGTDYFLAAEDIDGCLLGVMADLSSSRWFGPGDLIRPATPEESAPFRQLLDGLKRSLGEV